LWGRFIHMKVFFAPYEVTASDQIASF